MTRGLADLLLANLLILLTGVGLLPLLSIVRSRRELAARAGLAYLVGLAFVGILSATLAVVRIPFGWPALAGTTTISLGLAYPALLRRGGGAGLPRLSPVGAVVTLAGSLGLLAFFARAAHAFAGVPMSAWDAWAMWTAKARGLVAAGGVDPAFLLSLPHPRYPLLMPSIEAIDIRAMGTYDGQLLHVQFALIGLAAIAALASLLWDRVSPFLLWPMLVAIATAPFVIAQLQTAYVDLPLALFVAVGVTAAGRWLIADEPWCLKLAALMLAAALLTKSEGLLAVVAILFALAISAGRRRLKPVVAMGAAALAAGIPWWITIAAIGAGENDYKLTNAFRPGYVIDHAGRASKAMGSILGHLVNVSEWSLLLPMFAAALCVAAIARCGRLVAFAGLSTIGCLLGIVLIFDISTKPIDWLIATAAFRVVSTVVLAGAALTPLLVSEALRSHALSLDPLLPRRHLRRLRLAVLAEPEVSATVTPGGFSSVSETTP